MFRVGQKVVCVDDTPYPDGYNKLYPVKGSIYTIRGFHTESHIDDVGIYLEEVVNPPIEWSDSTACEWPFASYRFRPVVERSTDISIFTEMLIPASKHTEPAL
jgi:hypothetical protein